MYNKPSISLFGPLLAIVLFHYGAVAQNTEVVGSIPGEFDVANGAASYAIPIAVPPGRGGMQPELSLSYNSNSGNGILGVGWSLSGLSAIHRCARTIAQDGQVGGIRFNEQDRYCLDGQRLFPINGADGGLNAEYRSEIDGYSKITSHGGTANNPDYWVVKTKAGQVMTYGGAAAVSQTVAQGTISWSLSTINDTTGNNAINYLYIVDQNKQYLDKIEYPGGHVKLFYKTGRNDNQTLYSFGQSSRLMWQLDYLATYTTAPENPTQTTELNRYHFSYRDNSTAGVTTLDEIKQCSAAGECLKPVKLGWIDDTETNLYDFSSTSVGSTSSQTNYYFHDLNNDSRTDYIRHNPSLNNGAFTVYLASANGTYSESNWSGGGSNRISAKFYFNDYDGNGTIDYILHDHSDNSNGKFHLYLGAGDGSFSHSWTGHGHPSDQTNFYFFDVNNDGLTDYLRHNPKYPSNNKGSFVVHLGIAGGGFNSAVWTGGGSSSFSAQFYFGDYNGDSIVDYIKHDHGASDSRFFVYLGQGDGSFAYAWAGHGGPSSQTNYYFEDFNGDGLTDYLAHNFKYNSGNFLVYLAKGDGSFTGAVWQGLGTPSDQTDFTFADLNMDGFTDFIQHNFKYNGKKLLVFLGDGQGGFGPAVWSGAPANWDNQNIFLVDQNGDGAIDIIRQHHYIDSGRLHLYLNNTHSAKLKVNQIIDSYGTVTDLSYTSLLDASLYTKGSGSVYPYQDLSFPQYLVSQVVSSNGVGTNTTVNYQYAGLKAHMLGRGSLGFASITETYPDTNKTKVIEFDQSAFPLAGNIKTVKEYYNDQLINESTSAYNAQQNDNGIWQVTMDTSTQRSYELGNATTPITTVTTTHNNIDDFGNIGQVTVATSDGNQTFTKTTHSLYSNDTVNWILGRLQHSTVTHQSPYGDPDVRRSAFTYAANSGLLVTESITNASATQTLSTTTYTYDQYGHKTTVAASAEGETPRTSTTTFNANGKATQRCNALNQCETYSYTPQGWLASTTGPNGITTRWTYDGFGRKIREDRADDTWSTINRHFATSGNCGELAQHAHSCTISQSADSAPTIVQLDQLGRQVRKIKQGFGDRLVYSDTQYNHLAQVTRVSRDYYLGDHIYWANSEYDILGRVIRADEPGPHGSRNEILTEYNGLVTTVRSGPEQRAKTTTSNAIGQKIRIDEETGTYTEYTYNSDGNLLTTRVAGDNDTIITLTYDMYGRKEAMTDPDMGNWTYTYNGFGELVSQRDAKGQTVSMEYDILGRMIQRTEDEGSSSWEYFDNSAPAGSRGKLKREVGQGINRSFTYDALGRPTRTLTQIGSESFISELSYDELGRVKRTTYPGSQAFWTENVYDEHGFLTAIQGSRNQAESHDYSALQPLITAATELAEDYLQRADELQNLGNYYDTRIDNFQDLLAKQTITFENGTTAGLEQNRAYRYLSAGDGSTYYIEVPDTFIPIGSSIISPLFLAAEYHYQVTNTAGNQSITPISAAEFATIAPSLSDNGDEIYVLNDNTITCACEAVSHDEYLANLQQHQNLLGSVLAEGEASGINTNTQFVPIIAGDILIPIVHQQNSIALPPELLAHISNTTLELQGVQSLIHQAVDSYSHSAEQLVVLAEQTLMAADHNYQFVRTLESSAAVYNQFHSEAGTDTLTYWRAADVDASGRISAEVYGNGIVNDYAYNQATGQLQSIHSSLLVVDAIRHLEYQYDHYQNVTLRHDLVNDIRETYEYDRLDRLLTSTVNSELYAVPDFNSTQTQQYDTLGNITHKSDVGNYLYGQNGAGPHAVTAAGSNNYTYDANGNTLSGGGRNYQWSSFNKPTRITRGNASSQFSYDMNRARFKKINHKGDTTLYIGKLYEKLTKASNQVEQKHYIYAGGQLIAEHIVSTEQGTQTRYLHKDALGSVDLVTDAYANVVDRRSFDAWGKLRNLPWQSQAGLDDPLYLTQLPYTDRGYTGHEHVQEVGLIHMNGRVYDAVLARFVSADPHIQAGSLSQSYNRYSYVLNNPMKYNDPSGYFFKKLFKSFKKSFKGLGKAFKKGLSNKWVRLGLAIAGAFFGGAFVAGQFNFCSLVTHKIVAGAAGGFIGGLIGSGGDLKSAAVGGLTGGLAGWIGGSSTFGQVGKTTAERVVAHGVTGGTTSVLQGGKFGHGFVSSAFTKIVSKPIQGLAEKAGAVKEIAGTAAAALVGGTASALGGGKFANGAQTAAIQYLFNQASAKAKVNAIKKEVSRIKGLSDEEFITEFGRRGFSPGQIDSIDRNAHVFAVRKQLLQDLTIGRRQEIISSISPDGIDKALFVVSPISKFGSILDALNLIRWADTETFAFDYRCSSSGCRLNNIYQVNKD